MTNSNVDFTKVVPSAALQGEDADDTRLLKGMLVEAKNYLTSFKWCQEVIESYLGIGIGGIIAVFLFRIKPSSKDADDWVWVIVGDLPPAYLATDVAPNPAAALDAYIGAMEEWVEAASSGKPVDGLIPVNVKPTAQNAQQLRSRLDFLDREVLSKYSDDLKE